MKASTSTMTAEEKLELTRERNRIKQASLRQRRAARMAELEQANSELARLAGTAPLPVPKKGVRAPKRPADEQTPSPSPSHDKPPAQPVASGSGTSGPGVAAPPPWTTERERAGDDRTTKSDEEVARLTGVVSRLVNRLKEYGAGEGEIGRLIAGRETSANGSVGPGRSPLARLGTSNLSGTSYIQLTSPTSNERTSFQLPPLQEGASLPADPGDSSVFPFAFLFNDNVPPTSTPTSPYNPSPLAGSSSTSSFPSNHLTISAPSATNGTIPTLLLPSLPPRPLPAFPPPAKRSRADQDALQHSSLASTSETSMGPVPKGRPEEVLRRLEEVAALRGGMGDGSSENPLNKAIPAEWKEELLAIHDAYVVSQEGQTLVENGSGPVPEHLAASAQLLILRLLTATSSQKRLYDGERELPTEHQFYIDSSRLDERLRYLPDPLARVLLGKACDEGRINLTQYLARHISCATLYSDVWDWTGYHHGDAHPSGYPLLAPEGVDVAPTHQRTLAARPLPTGLRGAFIREIILGLDPSHSRASGPFVLPLPLPAKSA